MAGRGADLTMHPLATARLFFRLKLRLVVGNVRGDAARMVGFVFTVIAAIVVAVGGFLLFSLLRLAPADIAAEVGVLVAAVVFVGWAIVPLLAFGLDDTLDPAKLALFPLRTGPMAIGMFVASASGPWPLAGLVATAGLAVGLARDVGGVVLGVFAVLLLFALCLVTSRLITTVLSAVLRSRRGRDALAGVFILVLLSFQLPNLLLNGGFSGDPRAMLASAAGVLRWTPPGLAAHAVSDGGLVAVAELAALAVLIAVLAYLWIVSLRRALVTPESTQSASSVRKSRGGVARLLPDGPMAAVVAKDLKYARRDPRGRLLWLTGIFVTAITAITMNRGGDGGAPALLATVLPTALGGVMMGVQGGNLFALDGRGLWMNVVVYGSERDMRVDLAGRHLALSVVALPMLAAAALISAFLAGDPLLALPAALVGWALFGVALGVGAMTSVLYPYTMPERMNSFSGAAPGQGGLAFMCSMAAMTGTSMLALPLVVPVLFGLTWLSALALPYGLAVAWGGRRLAGKIGYARLPDILAAVSKPT